MRKLDGLRAYEDSNNELGGIPRFLILSRRVLKDPRITPLGDRSGTISFDDNGNGSRCFERWGA
jgi:hypothetical protein